MSATVYTIGATTAAAGSPTLAVPVTTATSAGDTIVVAGEAGSPNVSSITDSTAGNAYVQQLSDTAEAFHLSVWTASGIGRVGATVVGTPYANQTTDWGSADQFDTYAGRPLGKTVQKRYYKEESAHGSTEYPSAGSDSQNLAGLASHGIQKVLVSLKPLRDGTNNYSGNTSIGTTYTAEKAALSAACTYIKSVYPNAEVTLWQECNLNGGAGGFGSDSAEHTTPLKTPAFPASGVNVTNNAAASGENPAISIFAHITGGTVTNVVVNGSSVGTSGGIYLVPAGATISVTYTGSPSWNWWLTPYGAAGGVSDTQAAANYQAYFAAYAPTIAAAGLPVVYDPAISSYKAAVSFFPSNAPQYLSGVTVDYYCNDYYSTVPGKQAGIVSAMQTLEGYADQYGIKFGFWEWGFTDGSGTPPSVDQFVAWWNSQVLPVFQGRLAAGKPCADLVWYMSGLGPNGITGSTDPAVTNVLAQAYDLFNATTCAIPGGGTVTLTYGSSTTVKLAAVIGIAGLPPGTVNVQATVVPPLPGTPDQTATGNSASTTAPSATTGVLTQAAEAAIAVCASTGTAGTLTWTAPWTSLVSESNGASPVLSVAAQVVSSTAAVTASGTLTAAAATEMLVLTFAVAPQTSGSLAAAKPRLSGSAAVQATSAATGGLTMPKPKIQLNGAGPATNGVYLVGTLATGSGSLVNTLAVGANVAGNDTIVVGVLSAVAADVPTVGPDSAGNNYTLIASDAVQAGAQLYIFESDGSNPLTLGTDTIPVNYTSAAQPAGAIAVGLSNATGLDKFAIAHGSSAAPSSGATATLGQAEEYALAFITDAEAGGVPSWTAPWAALSSVDAGAVVKLSAASQVVTTTAALTAAGTITSAAWACGIVTVKVAPVSVALTPSNGILGVYYNQTFEAAGGVPPYTWAKTGTMPPGTSFGGGNVTGTTTTAGTYPITVTVTDAHGQTASAPATITILAPGITAPEMTLPTNLLSADDSVFSTGPTAFTWAAAANANAPKVTSTVAFAGSSCLQWRSQADGPTAIATGQYPVTAGAPYIVSCMMLPCFASRVCQAGVAWTSVTPNGQGGYVTTYLGTSWGPETVLSSAGHWLPLTAAVAAPAGATYGAVTVQVQTGNAGDVNYIDLAFFAQSSAQVLVDWATPTFAAGGNAGGAFMDVSPWLRLDGNGITYTRGRQDGISEIQPGSGSFELQNDLGQFARKSATALPAVLGGTMTLKRRAQINFADELGAWYTRFDGNISEIDYGFDSTGNTSLAQISLTDILADLNKQDPLHCWTREQALAGGPQYHWALDDPGTTGGAGVAAETSGGNGPPMRLLNTDSTKTAAIAWQDTSGGVETLADAASAQGADGASYWVAGSNQPVTPLRGLVSGNVGPFTTPIGSVMLTPVQTSQSAGQNQFVGNTGYQLAAELPSPIAPTSIGADYSLECWFMPDVSIASTLASNFGPYIALGLGSSRTYTNLLAGVFLAAGTAQVKAATYSQPPAFKGLNWPGTAAPAATASTSAAFTADKVKRPHHLVLTITGDPTAATVTLWVDGAAIGSFTLPKGQTYDTVTVGGAYGGGGAFYGNLSLVSVYPYALSAAQITQQAMLGQYGMWEQTTDDAIAQLAQYARVPGFWSALSAQHAGLSMTEYLDISNSNALSAMQQYEAAEKGLLFVSAAGALTFHTRAWRSGYRGPDLLLPPGTFSADLAYKLVDQFMVNEAGVAGPNTLGANATTLLANPSTGQTQTQTTASTVIQAGYVNTGSQASYGVYATNPVSAPLSLPLVTWSRGFAALGIPSYTYWPDPALSDAAAWDANSRAEPWVLPATVIIDLLTFEAGPAGTASPVGISSFYALEIDNMIAPSPGTLPPSFPDAQTSVEWFIEGITETMTRDSRTIQFYPSPAETQRAWIPGDATYGVLGATARLGLSAADLSSPQADGKDVSHDAGPPYWPPTFSATMNAPAAQTGANPAASGAANSQSAGAGFVGAADMRGIAQNLQNLLQPPLCVVAALNQAQTLPAGAQSAPQLFWDQVFTDTAGGMGAVPGYPNWYLVTVPGFYEIDLSVTWQSTGSQGGYTGQAWIIVAQGAAQALASGAATPLTVDQYVCPVGEAVRLNSSSVPPVCAATTRMYLGVGDMVCAGAEHNYTASLTTGNVNAGSMMSIRFAGLGRTDDRTLINSSLASGGTVSLTSHGVSQSSSFAAVHTYSYQGEQGFTKNARRNRDLGCYQGLKPTSSAEGSQATQIAFNVASMQSVLAGKTILSATLTGTNIDTGYPTGAKLMLGYTTDTPGGTTWDADDSNSTPDVMHQSFTTGQALTFGIPVSIITALVSHSAQALTLGDGDTTDQHYYGQWQGGPNSWTLTVTYV